ncbi:sensor histidine kinase [Nonomuraea sp. CA-143628]|uniref:sensor histidine kinase n=1 Tax=Nonomuraea sp. CA-143628 TaxID=3239997 RepID=UPI003D8AB1E5
MTEHTHSGDGPRGPFKALSRMARLGDVPVVIMLAWAGWLAVPWSFSGLAQARAAAAAAAAEAEPPPVISTGTAGAGSTTDAVRVGALATATPARAWGIPAVHSLAPAHRTVRALRDDVPCDGAVGDAASDGGPREDVLAAERARIAGEVHDAAGHGLAAIALQAGLALVTLDDDPEQARASLLAIRETSTTALTQLRAALDRLDPRDSTHDPHAGANDARDGAHDLPSLIDGVRAAGLAVDVEPADPVVPAHLGATVYGVVRESLTNVLRHAGPTQALVRLSSDPAGPLVLEIADRGALRSPGLGADRLGATEERSRGVDQLEAAEERDHGADRPGITEERGRDADRPTTAEERVQAGATGERGRAGTIEERGRAGMTEGRGLAGMRARVLAAGGHFTAGPRDGGGFQVLATFPRQPALRTGLAQHNQQPAPQNDPAQHNQQPAPQNDPAHRIWQPALQNISAHHNTADSPADLT